MKYLYSKRWPLWIALGIYIFSIFIGGYGIYCIYYKDSVFGDNFRYINTASYLLNYHVCLAMVAVNNGFYIGKSYAMFLLVMPTIGLILNIHLFILVEFINKVCIGKIFKNSLRKELIIKYVNPTILLCVAVGIPALIFIIINRR